MLTTETSTQSDVKRSLIQEIEQTPDHILGEVLDFLLFVRAKHSQDGLNIDAVSYEADEDIEDAKAALASIDSEGTISWESLKQSKVLVCLQINRIFQQNLKLLVLSK